MVENLQVKSSEFKSQYCKGEKDIKFKKWARYTLQR
jgi:hypothetical protein